MDFIQVWRERLSRWVFALVFVGWSLAAWSQIVPLSQVGSHPTAHTLGRGGFSATGGYVPFDGRLPRLNQPAMERELNIGGVPLMRRVAYEGNAGLLPIELGFGMGDATDFYLTGTLSSGTSEKQVSNFYGVPDDIYRNAERRFDRIYDQPLFDVGLGLKYQVKPDLGDGLPAVAVSLRGRFGFTSDDHADFQDSTPSDGFSDFGTEVSLVASEKMGELLFLHGSIGLLASRKLGTALMYGGAGEFALIPGKMVLSLDYATQRTVAGVEYSSVSENLTAGVRYHLSDRTVAQVSVAPSGRLLLAVTRIGEKAETVAPQAPRPQERLF